MKHRISYIKGIDFNKNQKNAGSKAIKDTHKILETLGYKPITPIHMKNNIIIRAIEYLRLKLKFNFLPDDSVLISNYPLRFDMGRLYYKQLLSTKNEKIIKLFVIHDIQELQFGTDATDNFFYERCRLDKNIYIISQTEKMKTFLVDKGIESRRIIVLGIFDYLTPIQENRGRIGNEIIIAGNLSIEKNGFLNQADNCKNLKFNLYGVGLDEKILKNDNFNYFGSFSPDDLAANLNGSFGLVWDSEELNGGIGTKAVYQKYNSPHKASLYLAAGIPIIVWKGAALAEFVSFNSVGLVVESLEELNDKISSITLEDYNNMKNNVLVQQNLIREGKFLKSAILKFLRALNSI